jgi:glycosyltransferase involved in cell wall biosynthesis
MKLAIVHDWLNQMGGAEDVLAELAAMFPNSPIYTSLYAPSLMPEAYRRWDIRPLWTDRLPGIHRRHQPYLPVYPLAWGGLDLSAYDVILSNKSGFCHGVQVGRALHICYCLAPTRYVWQLEHYIAREGINPALQAALKPLIAWLRRWDYASAQRVTRFVAISTDVQQRIRQFYSRESDIIFPPVDCARFTPAPPSEIGDYFLVVSRLIPYKRIDLAVQAATRLGVPLKVAGRGRDLERLRTLAGPTVEFLGYVPDEALPSLIARCRAFIFPGFEDFGITPVQAQAAGRPVIAYRAGGALDTVREGLTGEFFDEQTVDSLAQVMARFDPRAYDPEAVRAHALAFDAPLFKQTLSRYIEAAYEAHQAEKETR